MKSQMMTLFKELQHAQSKLDEAEGMKKNLQNRSDQHTHTHTHTVLMCNTFSKGTTMTLPTPFVVCLISALAYRCREVEQDVVTLKAQLADKQEVLSVNERLKLQVDSMQAQNLMEQRKTEEERSEDTHTHLLTRAYT